MNDWLRFCVNLDHLAFFVLTNRLYLGTFREVT